MHLCIKLQLICQWFGMIITLCSLHKYFWLFGGFTFGCFGTNDMVQLL